MSEMAVPKTAEEITPGWLTDVLRAAGQLPGGVHVTDVAVREIGTGRGYVGVTVRIRPRYSAEAPGAPASIIAKLPIPLTLSPEVHMLINLLYTTEITWYRELQGSSSVRTPGYVWSGMDPTAGRYCLLLEDKSGLRDANQVDSCGLEDARLIVSRLARMHAGWWNSKELAGKPWLYGPEMQGVLMQMLYTQGWPHFAGMFVDEAWMPEFGGPGERIGPAIVSLMTRGAASASTLVHGDYRLENFLFGAPGAEDELVVLDWQLCGRGSGARDLAYFMGQSLETGFRREHERDLIALYHETLLEAGVGGYSYERCYDDYRLGLLTAMVVPVNGVRTFNEAQGPSVGDLSAEQQANLEKALVAARALLASMAGRNVVAILDNRAQDLLG